MSEENKRWVAIGIALFAIWSFTHHKPTSIINVPAGEHRPIGWFDGVDVQLVKIDLFAKKLEEQERELSVLRNERMMHEASRPMTDEDIHEIHPMMTRVLPLVNASMVIQPASPSGMEPAKEPVKSTPVVTYAQPVKAFGHWERYGFLGRRRRWVSESSQAYQQYAVSWQQPSQAQKSGFPVLRRFGSCRGNSCR